MVVHDPKYPKPVRQKKPFSKNVSNSKPQWFHTASPASAKSLKGMGGVGGVLTFPPKANLNNGQTINRGQAINIAITSNPPVALSNPWTFEMQSQWITENSKITINYYLKSSRKLNPNFAISQREHKDYHVATIVKDLSSSKIDLDYHEGFALNAILALFADSIKSIKNNSLTIGHKRNFDLLKELYMEIHRDYQNLSGAQQPNNKSCSCSSTILFNNGCQCGAMNP